MAANEIVMQGFVYKQGAVVKNWKRRWLVLCADGRLLYFKPNKQNVYSLTKAGKNPPCGEIDSSFDVIEGESTNFMCDWPRDAPSSCRMALPVEDRTFFLYYNTAAETDRWMKALSSVRLAKSEGEPGVEEAVE